MRSTITFHSFVLFLSISSILFVITGTGYVQAASNYGIEIGGPFNPDVIAFPTSVQSKNPSNYYQQHHHHHFHDHDNDFHHFHQAHNHPHDHDQDFHQEGDSVSSESDGDSYGNSTMIPLDLIRKINNYTEVNDLLLNLVEGDLEEGEESGSSLLANRFGTNERSAAVVPKAAACIPELTTVRIAEHEDPSVLYIPQCTRVERCGGCCSHSLLMCQPKESETITYQVVKTQFVGGSKLKYMGKEIVLVEKHTKCKCDCKVQEKDCTRYQEYRKSECRCACTNIDEEKKCYKENATKLWNPEICACECRNIQQCSTGYTFDIMKCKCMPMLVRRRYAEFQESEIPETIKFEPLPVAPLDDVENINN